MDILVFQKLHAEGQLSDESFEKVKMAERNKLFSLHWELRTVLYLGILLLTSGLGILVYKNINTIGHQVILIFIALVCTGSFFYCFKKKPPYSNNRTASPNAFFDYILLLGCLTMITFMGYLQFQYNIFGTKNGLAAFIPMALLFFAAYYFDHIGVLTMAITNLCAWAGIALSPLTVLQDFDFNNETILSAAASIGVLLYTAGYFSVKQKFKAHFQFTYHNFSAHLLFLATLGGMFLYDAIYLLFLVILAALSYFFYRKALKEKSFYFVFILTLYFYIGFGYALVKLILDIDDDFGAAFFILPYFIGSAVLLILFLIRMNKKIRTL